MIATNFRTLPLIQYRLGPATNHPGDFGSFDQCPETIGTIACAVDLLNETELMHEEALTANADWLGHTVDDLRTANIAMGEMLPPSLQGKVGLERVLRFKNRESVLIGTYVVQACALLRMLRREYRLVAEFLTHIAPGSAPTKDEVERELRLREDEWESLRMLRNKVWAHTAFGDPHRDDDLGVELTSLHMYTGGDFYLDRTGVALGMSDVQVSGTVAAHVFGGVRAPFRQVSIASLAHELGEHLPKWHQMFGQVLESIAGVPKENVRSTKPNLVDVYVHRGAQAIPWHRPV